MLATLFIKWQSDMQLILLLWTVLGPSLACHRRLVNDVLVTHIGSKGAPKCLVKGQECKYDRNCCAGLECKMDLNELSIASVCKPRMVYEDYEEIVGGPSWKDYQEMRSPEENEPVQKYMTVDHLEERNRQLRMKLTELEFLRKNLKRQRLSDTKRKLEEEEMKMLKNQQLEYEKELKREVARLQEKEKHEKLKELMRKEVNVTLSKQKRVADLYMNMLADLVNKEGLNEDV